MNFSLAQKSLPTHVLMAVLLCAFCLPPVQSHAAAPLSIGTNPQGTAAYAVGAAVANVSSEVAGMQMRVVPQGGPPVTIPMVNKGSLEFSVANGLVVAAAHAGTLMYKDRPHEKLRLLCNVFPLHLGYVVQKDSDIQSIADLKGKRVPSRYTKQKNLDVMAGGLLATVGLTWDDVEGIPVPNGARGVDDFAAGSADCAFFSLSSGKMLQANASVNGIRVLPIPETTQAKQAIQENIPGSMIIEIDPEETKYPGIMVKTRVLSQPFLITVSADVSEDTAYALVKALYNSKNKMVAMHKSFNAFNPESMYLDIGVPYHPGAVKFFQEVGLK